MSGSRKGSLKQKSERFDSNINKRGNVKLSSKKEKQFTVGPVLSRPSTIRCWLPRPFATSATAGCEIVVGVPLGAEDRRYGAGQWGCHVI
jgi:hypothetical protein